MSWACHVRPLRGARVPAVHIAGGDYARSRNLWRHNNSRKMRDFRAFAVDTPRPQFYTPPIRLDTGTTRRAARSRACSLPSSGTQNGTRIVTTPLLDPLASEGLSHAQTPSHPCAPSSIPLRGATAVARGSDEPQRAHAYHGTWCRRFLGRAWFQRGRGGGRHTLANQVSCTEARCADRIPPIMALPARATPSRTRRARRRCTAR